VVLSKNNVPCAVVVFKRRHTRAVDHLSYVIDMHALRDAHEAALKLGVPCLLVIEWNDGIKWIQATPFERDIPLAEFKPLLIRPPMFNEKYGG